MAWWIYNNHNDLWKNIMKNPLNRYEIFRTWIAVNKMTGLEIIFTIMDNSDHFWDYINDMEKD
jgi:hypothetical protein